MDSYCTKCSLQFGNMTVYNMHLSIVHKENLEIKQEASCDILEKEIEEPEKVSLQCENCDKAFTTRSSLNRHVASIHEGKKPLKCDICGFSCSLNYNMKRHVASVHGGKKPFKCDICDHSFSKKWLSKETH